MLFLTHVLSNPPSEQSRLALFTSPFFQEGITMLVLSRQRDESIVIGDNIVITVVDIRGYKVRLGINAPREIPVHRQEVYDAIQRDQAQIQRDQAEQAEKQP